ncbi:MAG: hypothetical protein R3F50_02400 [Gammaproteobacteria bacterium]
MSVQKYLATGSLGENIQEPVSWCQKEAARLEKHQARFPAIVAAAEMAEDKLRIPWQNLDVLTEYHATLDNQLYKP